MITFARQDRHFFGSRTVLMRGDYMREACPGALARSRPVARFMNEAGFACKMRIGYSPQATPHRFD